MMIDADLARKLLAIQRNELTEHFIYKELSRWVKNKEHAAILARISEDEQSHYKIFQGISGQVAVSDKAKIARTVFMAKVFGLNFALKLMENGEAMAQDVYEKLKAVSPQIQKIIDDEEKHESELIDMIEEDRLLYVSSVVLGLNDALVELTGALAGFTLALQNTKLIGVVGLITGIAASMSMAVSEYLSTKQEDTRKDPLKASIYTGIAYVATVVYLILPYFIFEQLFVCLGAVIINSLVVIGVFTFYIAVAKGFSFRKRFIEMAGLSLTVAVLNFFIGLLIRTVFHIDI